MRESQIYMINYSSAFKIALDAAKKCFNVRQQNVNMGHIECVTRTSIWSWGEVIFIDVIKINSNKTKITIESSPSAQLFDWGKSRENIETFFDIFEQYLR